MTATSAVEAGQLVVERARSLIGVAAYLRDAGLTLAPAVIDCGGLVVWAHQGIIDLPRYPLEQSQYGRPVKPEEVQAGDLVFIHRDYGRVFLHVAIVTGCGTVVHASKKGNGVSEVPLKYFLSPNRFWGACRALPDWATPVPV